MALSPRERVIVSDDKFRDLLPATNLAEDQGSDGAGRVTFQDEVLEASGPQK